VTSPRSYVKSVPVVPRFEVIMRDARLALLDPHD
jgi:hypothetical protein